MGQVKVWMKVTLDDLSLPILVTDTCAELARIENKSVANIKSRVCKAKKGIERDRYICVVVDDED